MKHGRTIRRGSDPSREGFALLLVLILVGVAAVVGAAYVSAANVRRTSVQNLLALERARYVGESGLQHGMYLLQRNTPAVLNASAGPFTISTGNGSYVVSGTCLDSTKNLYCLSSTATVGGITRTCRTDLYWWSTYYATAKGMGPKGYWRLGDATATAKGEMGWKDGTYRGARYLGQTGALSADNNTAAGFDGTSSYVDLNTADPSGGKLTVVAWVKASGWACMAPRVLSKAWGPSAPYWEVYAIKKTATTGAMTFRLATGSTRVLKNLTASVDFAVGDWVFVAATYNKDPGVMKIYQNGVLVGSTAHSGDISHDGSVATWIGACADYGLCWQGTIDEVMIFEKELTDTQIKTLYAQRWANVQYAAWSN
ncbi:MAG: LamG domain-containing protein [Planctomycetota bacterium]|nr:LamG domain-containing protein [Planctomycetota bacterium]